jgi:hypothetical protein
MIEAIDDFFRPYGSVMQWTITSSWSSLGVAAVLVSRRTMFNPRWFWPLIAVVNGLFALEMAWPHRFELTELCKQLVLAVGGPEAIRDRRILQTVLIVAIVVPLVFIVARKIIRDERLTASARLALLGVGVGLAGITLETISLHYIDAHWFIYWTFQFLGIGLGALGISRAKWRIRPS